MLSWPAKDPNEVLDYQVDWTERLLDGETIATSTFILVAGSVTIESSSFDDGITTVWLSGGTEGEVCVVTNRIVTSEARTYDQSTRLRIRTH